MPVSAFLMDGIKGNVRSTRLIGSRKSSLRHSFAQLLIRLYDVFASKSELDADSICHVDDLKLLFASMEECEAL